MKNLLLFTALIAAFTTASAFAQPSERDGYGFGNGCAEAAGMNGYGIGMSGYGSGISGVEGVGANLGAYSAAKEMQENDLTNARLAAERRAEQIAREDKDSKEGLSKAINGYMSEHNHSDE
jgi:hypothetical protein